MKNKKHRGGFGVPLTGLLGGEGFGGSSRVGQYSQQSSQQPGLRAPQGYIGGPKMGDGVTQRGASPQSVPQNPGGGNPNMASNLGYAAQGLGAVGGLLRSSGDDGMMKAGSALSGIGAGVSAGMALGPYGALVGGLVGGGVGFFSEKSRQKKEKQEEKEQEELMAKQEAKMRMLNDKAALYAYESNGNKNNAIYKYGGYKGTPISTYGMGGQVNQITEDEVQFDGNTHENGGIHIGQGNVVEDGESSSGDYIFSDRLNFQGKVKKNDPSTFSTKHKKLARQKANVLKMPNKQLAESTIARIDNKINNLVQQQESVREKLNIA
jgi:hypothetical protein